MFAAVFFLRQTLLTKHSNLATWRLNEIDKIIHNINIFTGGILLFFYHPKPLISVDPPSTNMNRKYEEG